MIPFTSSAAPAPAIASSDVARDLVAASEGVLLDWDGCVAFGNAPHTEGLAFLKRFEERIAILSNNSTLWPTDIQQVLARHGVTIPVDRIVLAGHQAILKAAKLGLGATVFGDIHMRGLARQCGVLQVVKDPEVIVLLRDTRFTYARLSAGVAALAKGAQLIVANPDLTHPGPNGLKVPETGALLAAIAACIPLDQIAVEVVGKPHPEMFHIACQALKVPLSKAVMIGDNPLTDADGARRLGIDALLVRPGSNLSLADLC